MLWPLLHVTPRQAKPRLRLVAHVQVQMQQAVQVQQAVRARAPAVRGWNRVQVQAPPWPQPRAAAVAWRRRARPTALRQALLRQAPVQAARVQAPPLPRAPHPQTSRPQLQPWPPLLPLLSRRLAQMRVAPQPCPLQATAPLRPVQARAARPEQAPLGARAWPAPRQAQLQALARLQALAWAPA